MSAEKFDLLGHPVPSNHGSRGRDGHVPTPEMAMKIRALLADGADKKTVARETGLSVYLLNTHYLISAKTKEIQRLALDKARRANLLRLEQAAESGNVSAMRELNRLYQQREVELMEQEMGEPEPKRAERRGKKQIAELASQQAEDDLLAEIEAEAENALRH